MRFAVDLGLRLPKSCARGRRACNCTRRQSRIALVGIHEVDAPTIELATWLAAENSAAA